MLATLRWLSRFGQFPASRLSASAETLLLIATGAQMEEAEANQDRFQLHRREGAKEAALRAHALRRSTVHFKCDNSAKV